MALHRTYGGSTAARTLACPAWLRRSKSIPKPPTSNAAALGTALHEVLEQCIKNPELEPTNLIGEVFNGIELTAELVDDKIYPALDAIEMLIDANDHFIILSEQEVIVSEEIGGTADLIALNQDGTHLILADYKSGDGEVVWAEENEQLLFYCMCYLHGRMHNIKRITLAIIQPTERRDYVLDTWQTTPTYVEAFKRDYLAAVAMSKDENPPSMTGDHCRYCPAQALCPDHMQLIFSPLAQTEVSDLSHLQLKELSKAVALADRMEEWIKSVRKLAHQALERGEPVKHYKLVNKRATRVFNDEKKVEKVCRGLLNVPTQELYKHEFKSVAQVEKVLKAHGYNLSDVVPDQISYVSSGTTMVPDSDPRPAIKVSNVRKLVLERFK